MVIHGTGTRQRKEYRRGRDGDKMLNRYKGPVGLEE